MSRRLAIVLAVVSVMLACTHTPPQRPSQRNGQSALSEADSSLIQLMELNHRMADAADGEIVACVADHHDDYYRLDCGAWMRRVRTSDAPMPQADSFWQVHWRVRTLKDRLLVDEQKQVKIGRTDMVKAIDEAITFMHEGDTTEVLAPWYTAYGAGGNGTVPPYTNVRIEITIWR